MSCHSPAAARAFNAEDTGSERVFACNTYRGTLAIGFFEDSI